MLQKYILKIYKAQWNVSPWSTNYHILFHLISLLKALLSQKISHPSLRKQSVKMITGACIPETFKQSIVSAGLWFIKPNIWKHQVVLQSKCYYRFLHFVSVGFGAANWIQALVYAKYALYCISIYWRLDSEAMNVFNNFLSSFCNISAPDI